MSTKKMLFIILPFLFIFNNAVSFYIFNSSNSIAQNYHLVLHRVLLYQEIEEHVQQNVDASYQYILDQDVSQYTSVMKERLALQSKAEQLQSLPSVEQADLSQLRFKNLIQTYLHLEEELFASLNEKGSLAYAELYDELSRLANFINEESYHLIGLELSSYQTLYAKILLEVEQIQYSGLAILILNTIISLLLAYWISLRMTRPIQKLVTVAEDISNGQLQTLTPKFPNHSEFRILSETLEQMKMNIKKLIHKEKEALEKDKLLTQLELEVLQNQINPHFLFNSLNILSKLALIEGAEKTSDLTVALSNLFRYNLRKLDQPVPLRDEVQHAQEYIYIQQARFRERIQFITEVDEQQLQTLVPVLTLQPILENIFVHGMEGLERPVQISIKIYGSKEQTYIEISDNGVGMDEATRTALLHYHEPLLREEKIAKQKASTGIGTRNVFRRLELLYQQDNLVDIISRPNEGTTIVIRIPNHHQEVNDVPYINRR